MDRNCVKPLQRWRKDVALLAEGVDRNQYKSDLFGESNKVALLAEGVDRNNVDKVARLDVVVALLAEGVDRNA